MAVWQAEGAELYGVLQQHDVVVLKGDLNYRKLTGDRHWPYSTPLHTAITTFTPAPLIALRTIVSLACNIALCILY